MTKRPSHLCEYDTNKSTKKKIDKILEQCASLFANVGTNNKQDIGSLTKAYKEERNLLRQIKELDPQFYTERLKQ